MFDYRIRAGDHDGLDPVTEPLPDLLARCVTPLVLRGVMQEGSDSLVFVATVLQHEAGYGQQVRDVRDVGALATLLTMQVGGEGQGLIEARRHRWHGPMVTAREYSVDDGRRVGWDNDYLFTVLAAVTPPSSS
jgi:hypothetical protein